MKRSATGYKFYVNPFGSLAADVFVLRTYQWVALYMQSIQAGSTMVVEIMYAK